MNLTNKSTLTPDEIYDVAVATVPEKDIAHHNSDLYLRHTPETTAIVNRLENKALLSTFRDPDNNLWYELPFCFTPYWKNPSKYY